MITLIHKQKGLKVPFKKCIHFITIKRNTITVRKFKFFLQKKKHCKSLEHKWNDLTSVDNYAICFASKRDHHKVVQLLLKDARIDPSADSNSAVNMASENGYSEVVKLLLQHPKVDPSAMENKAIRKATENGHLEVVQLLLQDSRVDPSDA